MTNPSLLKPLDFTVTTTTTTTTLPMCPPMGIITKLVGSGVGLTKGNDGAEIAKNTTTIPSNTMSMPPVQVGQNEAMRVRDMLQNHDQGQGGHHGKEQGDKQKNWYFAGKTRTYQSRDEEATDR